MKLTYFGTVNQGVLRITNRKRFDSDLQNFEGKQVELTICRKKKKRSLSQNNYIHALFKIFSVELIDLTGDLEYSPEYVKSLSKCKFLMEDVVNKSTGEIIGQNIRHTSDLTTNELNTFFEAVIRWAAETFHIILPYPNEKLFLDM
jgi:hypothetical protein